MNEKYYWSVYHGTQKCPPYFPDDFTELENQKCSEYWTRLETHPENWKLHIQEASRKYRYEGKRTWGLQMVSGNYTNAAKVIKHDWPISGQWVVTSKFPILNLLLLLDEMDEKGF